MNNTNGKEDSVNQPFSKSNGLAICSKSFENKDFALEKIQNEAVAIQEAPEISGVYSKIRQVIDKTSSQLLSITIDNPNIVSIKDDRICKTSALNEIPSNDYKGTKGSRPNQKDLKEVPLSYNAITIHGTKFYDDESNRQDDRGNQKEPVLVRKLLTLIPPPAYPDSSVSLLCERDLKSQNKFIKCVLVIVLIMFIITAMFTVYVLITPEVKLYFGTHGWEILLPAVILLVFADCGMICSLCARSMPWNFIFSLMTIIPMSLFAAKISAFFNTAVACYVIISTGVVVFACILLACTSFDFTHWITFVLLITVAFATLATLMNIITAITDQFMTPLAVAVLYGSTIFQVVMFTIQLQMILGKTSAIKVGTEDYCLAAFLLYISILDIFLRSVHVYGLKN